MSDALKLQMKGVVKRFSGVLALDSVDFELRRGEVMALVGDNGAGKMTIAENIFLGREMTRRIAGIEFLDRRAMRARSRALLDELDVVVPDIHTWVEYLSGGQRQGVAIARALNIDAEIIVMDEPTAALAVAEVRKVLEFIKTLRRQGKSVVLISHNVQDVMEVSDRITVLRRGRRIAMLETSKTTPEEVVGYITGAALFAHSAVAAM